MTDETTQAQQDQEAVTAAEQKIVEDAANLDADNAALEAAKQTLANDSQQAPAAASTESAPDPSPDATPVPIKIAEPDQLDLVIGAGIKQYDGYAEHADIVATLRDFSRNSVGKSVLARDSIAATLQSSYKIEI
jgi:hypothetical protein